MTLNNIKIVLVSVLISTIIVCGTAYALTETKILSAEYANISITIDNKHLQPKDVAGNDVEPFIVEGTTYVPIRAISEAFGKNVEWDALNRKVIINTPFLSYEEVLDRFDPLSIHDNFNVEGASFKYTEVDLDGDGINELLIYDDFTKVAQIYSKASGTIKNISIPYNGAGRFSILPGNVFSNSLGGASRPSMNYTEWYRLRNGELEMVAKKGYEFVSNNYTAKEYFIVSGDWTDRETYEEFVADFRELDDEAYLETMTWKLLVEWKAPFGP